MKDNWIGVWRELEFSRERIFKKIPASEYKHTRLHIQRAELTILLNWGRRTWPHGMFQKGLAFDRLLLTISQVYQINRNLALALGVSFEPAVMSQGRALALMDPRSEVIRYCPVEDELRWLCSEDCNLPTETGFAYYSAVRKFIISVFHETSHAILFRLLRRKSSGNSQEDKSYLFMIEALVILNDMRLAVETGKLGQLLESAGVLYRSVPPDSNIKLNDFKDRDFFRSHFLYTWLRLTGLTSNDIKKYFVRTGRKFVETPLLMTRDSFLDVIAPDWVDAFVDERGSRFKLPSGPRPPPLKKLVVNDVCLDPKVYLRSDTALDFIQNQFFKIFGASVIDSPPISPSPDLS